MNYRDVSHGLLLTLGFVYHHVIIRNLIVTYNVRISMSVIRRKKILRRIGIIK